MQCQVVKETVPRPPHPRTKFAYNRIKFDNTEEEAEDDDDGGAQKQGRDHDDYLHKRLVIRVMLSRVHIWYCREPLHPGSFSN